MGEGDLVTVWLSDEAAKVFLGLSNSTTVSRWCTMGIVKRETPIGIWVEVDVVQEVSGKDNKVVHEWKVEPPTCLIRWDFITHVQLWAEEVPNKKVAGFIQNK